MPEHIRRHYDALIEQDNDPVCDPPELKSYMDLWDGDAFIAQMQLTKEKSVLEIGVGTGRLALRVIPLCGYFCGIDLSKKTIARAREHLPEGAQLICGNFLTHAFSQTFDVIYSSLTFMHIRDKQAAVEKIAGLLRENGRFVLSIDKNQATMIDAGFSRIAVYPDNPGEMLRYIECAGLCVEKQYETELAHIFVCRRGVS